MFPYNDDPARQIRLHGALGSENGLRELRQAVAEENLVRAAGAKARRQRLISIAIILIVLALIAGFMIFRIVAQ